MSDFGTEILLFAGTTEGRELADILAGAGVRCTVSVATEYGAQILGPGDERTVLKGRLTEEQMEFLIREEAFTCVVDATHPFATQVSRQIKEACTATGTAYLRLARETADTLPVSGFGIYEAATIQEAAQILRGISGNLFLTTGSKDLPALTEGIGDPERIYVRVLPSVESLKTCMECGIPVNHLVAMQGPFTQEMNVATLRQIDAGAIVTKESGKVGGFDDKIAAAKEVGIPAVVIKNPERDLPREEKLSFDQTLQRLAKITGVSAVAKEVQTPGAKHSGEESQDDGEAGPRARDYVMVAVGPGDERHLTDAARHAVDKADIVFGAPSVLERAKRSGLLGSGKRCEPYYKAAQVIPCMKAHPAYRHAAVLLSGDTGLYSGAAQLRKALEAEEEPCRVSYLPGISSVNALAAALQVTWEDAVILSTHGRERDVIGHLRREPKVFLLVGGLQGLQDTAKRLREAIDRGVLPPSIRIGCGYNLAAKEEEAGFILLDHLEQMNRQGLYILYLENPAAVRSAVTPGMEDEAFQRASQAVVPMTKEEVRVLALSRLRLHRHAVLYDIGAGTGSVSVEAARLCPDAQIYAVEKKPEAVEILRENLNRYCLHSVHVVEAAAPEGLGDLPAPTHIFIGGSGAALPDILRAVLGKNPRVRIVLTCVTLETLAQAMQAARELPVTEPQVRQIAVSRAETVGPYHMMKAQNPVYIIDFEGRAASIIQR